MKLVVKLFNGLRKLAGLLLPVFARAGDYKGWGPGLRWTILVLLLVAVLGGLIGVDHYFKITTDLIPRFPDMQGYWLAALILLVFVLGQLGWWIYKLWGPEEEYSDFPEIDEAWRKAVQALEEAGIGLLDAPLFLVLGRSGAGETAFFQAAQLELAVAGAPRQEGAPLHVHANREGIFVTCPAISLLGRQADILADQDPADRADNGSVRLDDLTNSLAMHATMRPGGWDNPDVKEVAAILERCRVEERALSEEERRTVGGLGKAPRRSLLRSPDEMALLTAKLKHLCRLIVRGRHPYCPLNGILVLIPLAATEDAEKAGHTGELCRRDVLAAREVFQTNCPLFALVCDMQTAPGFPQFVERVPDRYLVKRVGQGFPLVPMLNKMGLAEMIASGAVWICESVFPTWIYKLFQVEGEGAEDMATLVQGNSALFDLLSFMRERQGNLSRVLSVAVPEEAGEPPLFGGGYVAATGPKAGGEQAFVAGVLHKLMEQQNWVSWTARALAEEEKLGRLTSWGYIALGAYAALAAAGLACWRIFA